MRCYLWRIQCSFMINANCSRITLDFTLGSFIVFTLGFQGGSLHSLDICSEYRVCAHCPRITLVQIIFVSADNTSAAMNQLSPVAVLFLLILSFSRHCLLLFNVVWCLSLIQGSRCSRSQPQHCNISRWRAGWGEESKKSTFVWDNYNFIECQGNAKYSKSCHLRRMHRSFMRNAEMFETIIIS